MLAGVSFGLLDWLAIAAFLVSVVVVGVGSKLVDRRLVGFLTAGRTLTLPIFVATLVSTWYGGILGVGESVQLYGVGAWLLLGVPYYVFGVIYAVRFATRVREGVELSLPERIAKVWGPGSAVACALLILLLAVPATHVLMLGTLIQQVTDWPLWVCCGAAALVGSLFLTRSGMVADARFGVLAFAGMYLGFLVIDLYCFRHFDLGRGLAGLQPRTLTHLDGGQGPFAVLTFFILGAWTLVDPAFHQRVTSAVDPSVSRRGVLWSVVCWMVFDLLSIVAGLFALVGLKKMPENPVAIYPAFGDQILPSGLKGLFFIGMAGTVLSALVGYTLVSGSTLGREIAGRVWPRWGDSELKLATRVGLFVASLLALTLALSVQSVVDLWYSWSGAIIGALLIPVWIAYSGKAESTIPRWGIIWSMLLGFGASFMLDTISKRTHHDYLTVSWLGYSFSLGTLVPAFLVSAIVILIALAMGVRPKEPAASL